MSTVDHALVNADGKDECAQQIGRRKPSLLLPGVGRCAGFLLHLVSLFDFLQHESVHMGCGSDRVFTIIDVSSTI